MKKRSLVILMAFLMLFQSMAIFSANAEDEPEIIYLTGEQAMAESRADLVRIGLLECMFADTKGHWAEDIIDELAMAGVINGREDEIYDPDGTVTNAEFVKLLTCSVEEYEEDASFEEGLIGDVSPSDWYYSYVASAVDEGIIEGGVFLPNEKINRGETAIWISRALGVGATEECVFTDIYDEEVKKAVAAGYSLGIIMGYDAYTYGPDNTLTRAEAAALIQRVMRSYKELNTPREASNTLEYNENVIKVKDDGKNQIVSADESTGEIVFENCTEDVANVDAGQIIYIESCDKFPEGGAVKADAVEKTDNGITIKTSAPTLEEVFSEIDIADTVSLSPENFIPGSSDEGIVMVTPGRNSDVNERNIFLSNDEDIALRALNKEKEERDISDALVFEIGGKASVFEKTVSFGEDDLSGSVTVKSEILYDVLLDAVEEGKTAASMKVVCENSVATDFTYSKETKYDKSWKLGSFKIPISGPLAIVADFELIFTAEGEFELNVNTNHSVQLGVSIKDGNATLIKKKSNDANLTADAEGELRLGPNANVGLGLTSLFATTKIIDINAQTGVGISAETAVEHKYKETNGNESYTAHNNTPDENGNIHICDVCIDGEIFAYINGDVGISREITDALSIKDLRLDLGEKPFKIADWYYSVSGKLGTEFGWGECPNLYKKLEFSEIIKPDTDIFVGDEVNLRARVPSYIEAEHPIGYAWYKDDERLYDYKTSDLIIPYATEEDSGNYYCVAYYQELGEGLFQARSDYMEIDIDSVEPPDLDDYTQSDYMESGIITIRALTAAEELMISQHAIPYICYIANEVQGINLTYQWYKNGVPLSGFTSHELRRVYYSDNESHPSNYFDDSRINNEEDAGIYFCVIKAFDDDGNLLDAKISHEIKLKWKSHCLGCWGNNCNQLELDREMARKGW